MSKNYRTEFVGVFGWPVDENPTVVMQEAAFKALGLPWRYLNLLVAPQDLAAAFAGLRAMHFAGVNLTIPHKVAAMQYVDELTEKAKLIGAINTVAVQNGRLLGDNTDGAGFVQGLARQGVSLTGKTLTVLGAGGASRAICVESALAGAAAITIINRDVSKAQTIADIINKNIACTASVQPWQGTASIPACNILINATSVGLHPDASAPDINYEDITSEMIVQDIIPNPAQTPFLNNAAAKGARCFNGLAMLVQQGAIGFKLWTGQDAPIDVMYEALEKENT